MKEEALRLFDNGFLPIPLNSGEKRPSEYQLSNFEPVISGDLVITRDRVEDWFTNEPNANVGIMAHNILIIDVDFLKGEDKDHDAYDYCFLNLKTTYKVKTYGGFHAYYRKPSFDLEVDENGDTSSWRGIDIMQGARYVVAPPSVVNKNPYIWVNREPKVDDLPFLTKKEWAAIQRFRNKKSKLGRPRKEVIAKPSISEIMDAYSINFDKNSIQSKHINCPFPNHDDKKPSFRLDRKSDEIYHCTCAPVKDTGDYIQFVASMEGWLDYKQSYTDNPGVCKKVAEKLLNLGIKFPDDDFAVLAEEAAVLDLNQDHFFFANKNGSVYIEREDGSLHHLTPQGFRLMYSNIKFGKKTLGQSWLESPMRRDYQEMVMRPEGNPKRWEYNLFKGWPVSPKSGNCDVIIEHIEDTICQGNKGLSTWLLDWLAHIFQYPEKKPGTAVVLYSHYEGTGKGSLVRLLKKLLGKYMMETPSLKFLDEKFNSYLKDKILIVGDEATWGGNKKEAALIRNFITEPTLSIEEKMGAQYDINSCHRLLITTNSSWAIPMGTTDRRWTAIEMNNKRVGDDKYFERYYDAIEDPSAFLEYLLTRKITTNLTKIFETNYKVTAKLEDMDPFQSWWIECLENEVIGELDVTGWRDSEISVRNSEIFNSWVNFSLNRFKKVGKPDNVVSFSKQFLKLNDPKKDRDKKGTILILPKLSASRDYFVEKSKLGSWEKVAGSEVTGHAVGMPLVEKTAQFDERF